MNARLFGLVLVIACAACHRCEQRPPAPSTTTTTVAPCPDGMILVPGDTFAMGDIGIGVGVGPQHSVTVSSFCLDRTEVTAADYARCDTPACRVPDVEHEDGCAKATLHPRHPRNCVTWHQARAFCEFRGGHLPNEAQWEYAARGTEGRYSPWGNEPGTPAHVAYGDEIDAPPPPVPLTPPLLTFPVGSYPLGRTPLGLDDMAGNVAEWVADWLGGYSPEPATDPAGPSSGTARVVRGGAYVGMLPENLRTYQRYGAAPDEARPNIGFRCASSLR